MAQQTINVGAAPNDGTGTPLRTAFQYTNSNFSELYTAVGPSGNNIVVPGSATITGDLTVDTSTLKVDSANNRVGIGTATPGDKFHVVGGKIRVTGSAGGGAGGGYLSGETSSEFHIQSEDYTGGSYADIVFDAGNGSGSYTERYRIDSSGNSTWSNVGNVAGTAMTLNSTGLGVGASPVEKLTVAGRGLFVSANPDNAALKLEASAGTNSVAINFVNTGGNYFVGVDNSVGGRLYGVPYSMCIGSTGAYPVVIATNNTARLTVDSSGNVGIGVTPSAWASTWKAIQVGAIGSLSYSPDDTGYTISTSNGYWNGSNWIRIAAAAVSAYSQNQGKHSWLSAASSSAGSTIAFGDAKMTLDESGNLLVGPTSGSNSRVVKAVAAGTTVLEVTGAAGYGSYFQSADAQGSSSALSIANIGKVVSTGRSINAGGTVNASGADYAEYMVKCSDFTLSKGGIAGIDANAKLTNVFADAISFVVKSTDPSYVGNDKWGVDLEGDALEAARQLVDRIAFAGQVPVNVIGAKAGDYIVPVVDGTGIKGIAVASPTFEQYQIAVGKVIAIDADGRARIIVKVA